VDITYFTLGNPNNWRDGWEFQWTRGRQLRRAAQGDTRVYFEYDHAGIRTRKTVVRGTTPVTHDFYTQGGRIVAEVRRLGNTVLDTLEFFYDESGRPVQMRYNGVVYNYVLNLQGDVVQIRRASDGRLEAQYVYNAWGQLLYSSGRLAEINPIRYRGYFYDVSTGLYYLQSRYYDPVVGRFINADADWVLTVEQDSLLQWNLFAYMHNNPVNGDDPDGYLPRWARVAIGVVAVGIGVVATVATGGAAAPALIAGAKALGSSAAIGAGVGAAAVSHRTSTGSWSGAGRAAWNGALDGAANGAMLGGIAAGAEMAARAVAQPSGFRIESVGRQNPVNRSGNGHFGVRYSTRTASGNTRVRSFELHPPHRYVSRHDARLYSRKD